MERTTRAFTIAWVIASAMLLASCATMSPEECQVADWREVGQRDGLRGEALSLLGQRAEDGSKANVSIDAQVYRQGRDLGLASYCRLENAVPLGLGGASYLGVCPVAIDAVFQQRYQVAHAVYVLRKEVKDLDERTESLERRLREVNHKEDERLRGAGSDQERNRIHQDVDDERRAIHNELGETDRRLHRKRDELRSAEFDLGKLR